MVWLDHIMAVSSHKGELNVQGLTGTQLGSASNKTIPISKGGEMTAVLDGKGFEVMEQMMWIQG